MHHSGIPVSSCELHYCNSRSSIMFLTTTVYPRGKFWQSVPIVVEDCILYIR